MQLGQLHKASALRILICHHHPLIQAMIESHNEQVGDIVPTMKIILWHFAVIIAEPSDPRKVSYLSDSILRH
jgi:hypothetical protein